MSDPHGQRSLRGAHSVDPVLVLRDLDDPSVDLCALAVVHVLVAEVADRQHELFAVHLLAAKKKQRPQGVFQFVNASVVAVVRPEETDVVRVVAVGVLVLPELGPEH